MQQTNKNPTEEQKLREQSKKLWTKARDESVTGPEREAFREKATEIDAKIEHLKPSPGEEQYRCWVQDGQIVARRQEDANWELGELASKVEGKYGEGRLQQYAEDIGVNYGTLQNCCTTFLTWEKPPRGGFSFGAAKALNHVKKKDPERAAQIIARNPNLSAREAAEETRAFRQEKERKAARTKTRAARKANGKDKTESKIDRRQASPQDLWRSGLLFRAQEAAADAAYEDWSKFKVDQQILKAVRDAAEAWEKLAAYVESLTAA